MYQLAARGRVQGWTKRSVRIRGVANACVEYLAHIITQDKQSAHR